MKSRLNTGYIVAPAAQSVSNVGAKNKLIQAGFMKDDFKINIKY